MDSGELPEQLGSARKPVLVILHQEHSTAGHVGHRIREAGHAIDIRRPRYGDPLPDTLAHHAGAIIFGGPMSANDVDDFVRREIELVALALREEAPFLGICLGAQMMAACLGAKVAPDADGHVEMGYYDIAPTDEAQVMGGPWPSRVYQWHAEGFGLPAGSVPLAGASGAFPNQAFRFGRAAVGLQFHPEITYAMAARWSGRNETKLPERRGARLRPEHLAEHVAAAPAVQRWLPAFLAAWLTSSGARIGTGDPK